MTGVQSLRLGRLSSAIRDRKLTILGAGPMSATFTSIVIEEANRAQQPILLIPAVAKSTPKRPEVDTLKIGTRRSSLLS